MSRLWFRNLRLKAAILSASGLLTLGIFGIIEAGAPGTRSSAAATATPTPQAQMQADGEQTAPSSSADSGGGESLAPQPVPQHRTSRGS